MSESKPITEVTIAVACVVAGKNCKIGQDVKVNKEDGAYLVGASRAVRAGTDEAKAIKEAIKEAAKAAEKKAA